MDRQNNNKVTRTKLN